MDDSNKISVEPVTSLGTKLLQLSKSQTQPCIYKVRKYLRNINDKAYEPEVVAIGPYHSGKDNLQMMEKHKLRYLESLLHHKNQQVELYISAIRELEERARSCYSKPISLDASQFIEMLVLDGCFIIELLRKCSIKDSSRENDPIFQMLWVRGSLQRDLILFENQIPFFVLRKLFDLIEGPGQHGTLIRLILLFCHNLYPSWEIGESDAVAEEEAEWDSGEIKHLLHLIHDRWCPLLSGDVQNKVDSVHTGLDANVKKEDNSVCIRAFCCLKEPTGGDVQSEGDPLRTGADVRSDADPLRTCADVQKKPTCADVVRTCADVKNKVDFVCIRALSCLKKPSTSEREFRFNIPSATELTNANVSFSKRKYDDNSKIKSYGNLFQIGFEKGVLVMPQLRFSDYTESLFRNLIAYEQYFPDHERGNFVTDYVVFMDGLINTSKDVEILSKSKIIDNCLGDNEVLVGIFNRLNDSVSCSMEGMYSGIVVSVNEHYERPWNHAMAVLRRDYFSSPWALIAFFTALLLLLLTVVQTVCSVIQLWST